MFNKHALKTGVVAAIAVGITFTACKKDDNNTPEPTPARSTSFDLLGTGADAAKKVGAITVTENKDSSVNVVLKLTKNVKDTVHHVFFIGGTFTAPTKDTLLSTTVKGTGSELTTNLFKDIKKITLRRANGATKDTSFKYDDAVKFSANLKVLHSAFKADKDTIAIGNFGKSK
ncbi:hypothetical protein [Chitinophaga nivalis]|uniref:Lipoprotein n=1 Tax=Chitinophaga nivalis TaxID=2991709 RepID=A0ABT3IUL8_9BACT|nr:hypothetical protein [Chitinophaga nivalis]MCW3462622.1 hypothetical protein [Chitinophaga nivalis]MCW3487687.1 hypothetical protein [Chitinophaga nivalis]